jgi:hypothetical protein
MNNLIITNSSGLFSTLLGFFFWVYLFENNNFDIDLNFHTRNKSGPNEKKYYFAEIVESNLFPKKLLFEENIFLNIFKENKFLVKDHNLDDFLFTHLYPSDIKEFDEYVPECLKVYRGRGFYSDQYENKEIIDQIRKCYYQGWKVFELTDELKKISIEEEKLISSNTLCVMLRTSLHYDGYGHNSEKILESAVWQVSSVIDDYDKVLITTQVQPFYNRFKQVFGNKCVSPERPKRLSSDMDWIGVSDSMSDDDYIEELKYCLLDVILSSKCNHIIGSSSNMFLGALSMNPNIDYSLITDLSNFNGL